MAMKKGFVIAMLVLLPKIPILSQEPPQIDFGPSDLIIEEGRIQLMSPGGSIFVGEGAGSNILDWESIKCNTGVGQFALYGNYQGSYNTAIGGSALFENYSGDFNTAVGCKSLYSNITGNANTVVGYEALLNSQKLNMNTALGFRAMALYNASDSADSFEAHNTAVGHEAMFGFNLQGAVDSLMPGYDNTAVGSEAMYSIGVGRGNTAIGRVALYSNNVGDFNTALGSAALQHNIGGSYNTALGYEALKNNNANGPQDDEPGGNTAVGSFALSQNETGRLNTALGNQAGNTGPDFMRSTAIGYRALCTGSFEVRIGDTNVNRIGGNVGWSRLSDGRFKADISEDVMGLDFINALRPITYHLDRIAMNDWYLNNFPWLQDEFQEFSGDLDSLPDILYSGFIAQEVEETANQLGYEFSGVDAPQNDKDLYGLRYATLTVPLVKAVQELSALNQNLMAQTAKLTTDLEHISKENEELREFIKQGRDSEVLLASKIIRLEKMIQKLTHEAQ